MSSVLFFLNKIRCAKFFCRTPLYPMLFCVLHDHNFSFLRYQKQRCQVLKISMILRNTSPEQKIVELSTGLPGESQATMGQDLVSREKNPFLKVESKPRTKTFLMSSAIFFLSKFSVPDVCCRLSLFIQYWFSLNKIVACPFGVLLFCFFIWCKFLLNLQLSSLLPYFPYFLHLAFHQNASRGPNLRSFVIIVAVITLVITVVVVMIKSGKKFTTSS